MPRVRRKARSRRRTYTDDHIEQLCTGIDFGHGFGYDNLAGVAEAWLDHEIRRRVYERCAERFPTIITPWAARRLESAT